MLGFVWLRLSCGCLPDSLNPEGTVLALRVQSISRATLLLGSGVVSGRVRAITSAVLSLDVYWFSVSDEGSARNIVPSPPAIDFPT